MSPAEANARAYCAAIGKDPDEIVLTGGGTRQPRWQGLIGASAESAAGSTDLSPNQVALLRTRRPA